MRKCLEVWGGARNYEECFKGVVLGSWFLQDSPRGLKSEDVLTTFKSIQRMFLLYLRRLQESSRKSQGFLRSFQSLGGAPLGVSGVIDGVLKTLLEKRC